MKKKKPIINKYLLIFAILTGAILAIFTDFGPIDWVYIILFIPMLILALQPIIIIHELGHMVLGLMSGYRFLSFRYLSWIIIKDKEGKFHLNRYSIVGTGGQCLMIPPDKDDIPIFWYNVGGVLFNAISIMLAVFMMFWFSNAFVIYVLSVFIFMSVLLIALNWLPIKDLTNDGNNYRESKKNIVTKQAFYDIIMINMYYYYGYRSNSIPLRSTPEHLSYETILQAAISLFIHSKKLFALDIEGFKQGINEMEIAFQSKQLQMLPSLKIYVYIVRLLDRKLDDPIFSDKALQTILKRSKYEPLFYIIRYVESTIRGHEDSNKIKTAFFQLAQKSHLQGEVLDCIELLDYLDQRVLFPSFLE